jgi:crossover junction endodeoxyribonuclease RuvC
MIILGIDPGLATMGFGVISADRGRYTVLDYGIVSTPKDDTLPVRLGKLEQGVSTLINTYKPDQVAVEELFFSKNVSTGIAVAEARGVILLTCNKLLGDEVYAKTKTRFEKLHAPLFNGQALHAKKLTLTHPRTKERMSFECELPDNFKKMLELLEKEN